MTSPNNDVLAEQIKQLKIELASHKDETRKDRDNNAREFRELGQEVELIRGSQSALSITMEYVKETVKGIDQTVKSMAETQKKESSKNTLLVSILQVGGGIVIAVIGYWAKGAI